MTIARLRTVALGTLVLAQAAAAAAQAPIHLIIAGGVGSPVGQLGSGASAGASVDVRLETRPLWRGLGLRLELSSDNFGGRGTAVGDISSYRAIGASANFVHHSVARLYEFVGAGPYLRHISYHLDSGDHIQIDDEHQGLGLQAGFGIAPVPLAFVEVGVRSLNVRSRKETWMLFKVGFRLF